jgi:hypothetical protein
MIQRLPTSPVFAGRSSQKNEFFQKIPTPSAAKFSTIITSANRYIPIVSPIAACIAKMQASQKNRVFLIQMKTG